MEADADTVVNVIDIDSLALQVGRNLTQKESSTNSRRHNTCLNLETDKLFNLL